MSSPTATLNPDIISEVKPGCGFFTSDAETVGNVAVQDYSISYEIHGTGPIKVTQQYLTKSPDIFIDGSFIFHGWLGKSGRLLRRPEKGIQYPPYGQ